MIDQRPVRVLDTIAAVRPSRAVVEAWSTSMPALQIAPLDDFERRLLDRHTSIATKDAVLEPLLRLARRDPDALLALCRCFLPALRRMARSFGPPLEVDDVDSEVVGAFLHAVASYPLHRRPHGIASNLTLDALAQVCQWAKRERAWIRQAEQLESASVAAVPPPELSVIDEAVGRGLLTPQERDLMIATRIHGVTLHEAARATGCTYDALKKRRRRAEQRLIAWLGCRTQATTDAAAVD